MKKVFQSKSYSSIFLWLLGLFFSVNVFAQQIKVQGQVKAESGEPIIGANVVVKGTTNGTITDIDGHYVLSNVNPKSTLVFSFIGYIPQEQHVAAKSILNIVLQEDSKVLNEVVVIGYGTAKKSDLTGAVGSVGAKDLKDAPVANIGQALQGKVSGVQINDAGAPGDNVTIKIRGLGTINNSNPLVVIDGVPTDLGLSSINMVDVERVDVLKDASATAIYGSRGANGVVLISTKKGKNGKGIIGVTANWNIQDATNVPDMLNAKQYAAYSNDMLKNAGLGANPAWSDPSTLSVGTDWLDELLKTGVTQNYTLNFSGGDDTKHYYISGGLYDQNGIVRNTDYRRYTFQSNTDFKLNNWLKLINNITFSTDNKNSGDYSIANAMYALPTQSIKDENGGWSGPIGNAYWYGDIRNPIGTAETTHNNTKGYNLLANISAEITFAKYLKFKSTFGYDAKFWYENNFTPAYAWKPIAVAESSRFQSSKKSFTYLWDNYFTYDNSFGKHHVSVMAGTSAQNNKYDFISAQKSGFLYDSVSQLGNGSTIKSADGNQNEWAIFSLMARANYDYADKYLLTATVRRDGSSRFGSGNKYGIFPSFSTAWRISQESWFPKTNVIDDLKFRFGYGITGNQEIGNYNFASTYNTGVYSFGGTTVNALSTVTMANPNIHWEEVRQTNLGFDLSMLNRRVYFAVDAYLKNTCDMLVKAAIPITSGFEDTTTTFTNAGKVQNKGVEMTLNTVNFNDAFKWETSVTATYNKNKIVDLNSNTPLYQNQYNNSYLTIQKVGAPINAFYGYVTGGIFQTSDEVAKHAVQVQGGTAAGDIKFNDLNNDGVINENDRTIIGNPNPDWIFSMNNTFSYKGFDLSIFLQGVEGNDIYNVNAISSEGMSAAYNQTTAVLNRWTGAGTSYSMPRAVYADPNQNCRASNRFIENGSYLRIKNVTLGYTFPQRWIQKMNINSARINMSCENLVTFTNYSGFDPEVAINGIDSSRYPLSRTFSLGLNVNF